MKFKFLLMNLPYLVGEALLFMSGKPYNSPPCEAAEIVNTARANAARDERRALRPFDPAHLKRAPSKPFLNTI